MKYLLKSSPETVHWGFYDRKLKPVLRVKNGDILEVYTVETETLESKDPQAIIPFEVNEIFEKVKERGPGPHILTGPVYIDDATPGDTLEISLLEIKPWVNYGFNLILPSGVLKEGYEEQITNVIHFDRKGHMIKFSDLEIPFRPFFGELGVAPASGRISSLSVGTHGGNLDNKELLASSKVYLPVHVNGALFSIGDGHACQGDGEVDSTALETCMWGIIQLKIIKNFRIKWPMAETIKNFIIMASAPTLDEALEIVVANTVEFLMGKGFDKDEAYIFCSLGVDFRITQAVNDLKGVHAMVPKEIMKNRIRSLT